MSNLSQNQKIIIIVVIVLLLCCCCAVIVPYLDLFILHAENF